MQYKPAIQFFILCFILHSIVGAQSVIYSSTISTDINTSFEVIGKAGNFYWLYKNKKNGGRTWPPKEERSFEVYDDRLHLVKEISSLPLSDSVLKQYLIPQKYSFDQLMFKKALNKTSVMVRRGLRLSAMHIFLISPPKWHWKTYLLRGHRTVQRFYY
jgi:hypothetical protein